VLHHVEDFQTLLAECLRVCSGSLVVKDHFSENWLDRAILRLMDWAGNALHAVASPGLYLRRKQWEDGLAALRVSEDTRQEYIPHMYPFPWQCVLGRRIQFMSSLVRHACGGGKGQPPC
jgi:hypothetical protein